MDEIRLTVVHALGRMSANKAIPILEEMKNDKSKIVRGEVGRYLEEFSSGQR
jgi:HEAT repeat protein